VSGEDGLDVYEAEGVRGGVEDLRVVRFSELREKGVISGERVLGL
jgi:hypothetical protein